jgi:hypothetical protein
MARSVIQLGEEEVHPGSHAPEDMLSDHEPESPVGSPEALEHPVGVPGKGNKRRETLLQLADEEGTDLTWEEFQQMITDPKLLYREVVEVIQNLRDLNGRHEGLRTQHKENKTKIQKLQEALIKGLLEGPGRQATPSDTSEAVRRSAKIQDPAKFSGKFDNGTAFDDWLVQVKNKLRGNRDWYDTAESRLIYVAGLLEGDALAMTSTRMDPDHVQYYRTELELYQHLQELYTDPNREKNARAEFKRLYMKKDQTFQTFYATFLRLVADGKIVSTDLKEKLNNKLSWKLQETVSVYYNDKHINLTQFAQHCVTIDQQIRTRTAKQERADKRSGGPGERRKKPETGDRKTDKPTEEGNDKTKSSWDRSLIKCYNCEKLGHIAKDCRAPKKDGRPVVAPLEEGTDSDEPSGKA